jgi:cyclophilin family peptidyl-prolyl cis-trans isomerase
MKSSSNSTTLSQRRLKRASGGANRWPIVVMSWLVALTIFSLIVLVSRTPSVAEHTRADETPEVKNQLQSSGDGDVIVECKLDTPHDTSAPAHGTLHIAVRRSISPLASDAFLHMVKSEHFNGCYLFRVVKGFIVQWGIESPQSDGQKPKTKFDKVGIDPPVTGHSLTNVRGSLNFAGGNSATGQVYVNINNNPHLDKEPGSLPFAMLDDKSMEIILSVYDGYKAGMGQVKAVNKGSDEVKRLFPKMSRIETCWVVSSNDW